MTAPVGRRLAGNALELFPFEEALPDVAFLQEWNIEPHDQLPALHRQRERALQCDQIAVADALETPTACRHATYRRISGGVIVASRR